ncbi:MAG: hypothetical protein FWD60_04650 [Candidatus Azobacteroides sp.]|nr:hypothetical protein [Candidatus Azobacteroides sp.]
MIIAIDFDGTCVTHEFPNIGDSIGAEPVLKELVGNGHQLILFTMRSDIDAPESDCEDIHSVGGKYLTDAVNWFKEIEIPLWGINENPEQKSWTHSPKPYANLYIDDSALGIPLVYDLHELPYVDWIEMRKLLVLRGLIKENKDENN